MRPGFVLTLAVGTALVGTVAVPAATAAPRGVLVLDARGSAATTLTLRHAVRVLPLRLAANGHADGWSWKGCGRIRGFALRPLGGDPMAGTGAVDFADLRWGSATDLDLPGGPVPRTPVPLGIDHLGIGSEQSLEATNAVTLPAGRYRAVVLGEGSCEVRVPLAGLRGTVRRHATQPVRMRFHVEDVAPAPYARTAVPAARAGIVTVPLVARPATFAFAMMHRLTYQGAFGPLVPASATAYGLCVEADSDDSQCKRRLPTDSAANDPPLYHHAIGGLSPTIDVPGGPSVIAPITVGAMHLATWYRPGKLPPGPVTAKITVASVPATALQAVAFAADL